MINGKNNARLNVNYGLSFNQVPTYCQSNHLATELVFIQKTKMATEYPVDILPSMTAYFDPHLLVKIFKDKEYDVPTKLFVCEVLDKHTKLFTELQQWAEGNHYTNCLCARSSTSRPNCSPSFSNGPRVMTIL